MDSSRTTSQNLEGKVRKKCRVHALSNKQAKQRLDRGLRFLCYINGRKWKNVITIDRPGFIRHDVNGIRKIYFEIREERSPESWTKFWKEFHPKGVMFVAGVCCRRKTAIRFVKLGAKINNEYHIQHVSKPLFKNDIRKIFLGELINKVVFHHDSAPAHSSGTTQEWFRNSGVTFIPKEHWMGNNPDLAPWILLTVGVRNTWFSSPGSERIVQNRLFQGLIGPDTKEFQAGTLGKYSFRFT
ncbi:hypothetical protein BV898_04015 [Hypsibius exemplaris]|uniref:Tc1-like transposase DDE domain-containing protein n=1 Tax=Hypsibius exemplaris TaxID=2072580 RepID=A0A1W0X409_HYPEX|nr:hypothetical protein BV898_04015 [Hypsibius exemplaris]